MSGKVDLAPVIPDPKDPQGPAGKEQRAYLNWAADQIERTASLKGIDHLVVAEVLRAHAKRIPDEPKRAKGQAPQFNAGVAALTYVRLLKAGMKPTKAIEHIAELADVSVEAIKEALRKKRTVVQGFQKAVLQKPNRKD